MWWAVDQPIPIHPRVDIPSPWIQCSLRVVRWPTKGRRTGCRLECPARHGMLPDDISSSLPGQTGPAARSMSALLQVCRSTCNLETWAPTRSRRRDCHCQLPVPATYRLPLLLLLLLPGIEADRIDDGLAPESGNQSARSRG